VELLDGAALGAISALPLEREISFVEQPRQGRKLLAWGVSPRNRCGPNPVSPSGAAVRLSPIQGLRIISTRLPGAHAPNGTKLRKGSASFPARLPMLLARLCAQKQIENQADSESDSGKHKSI